MKDLIRLAKKKNVLIAGTVFTLILFISVMVYSSRAYADKEYWDIKIGNKTIAVVSSESEGNKVVDGVKKAYVVKGAKVESVTFDKKLKPVKHEAKKGSTPKVSSADAVVKKITDGSKGEKKYTVKDGDTAWDVAYFNGITYDELIEMNKGDDFNPDEISTGDKIVVDKKVPYINVKTKQVIKSKEKVEPEVEYIEDPSMYEGEAKVKEEGEAGSKIVKFRQVSVNDSAVKKDVLTEKVTKKAKKKVVIVGTKENQESAAMNAVYGSGGGSSIVARAKSLVGSHMDCVQLASNALAAAGIGFSGWPEQFLGLGSIVPGGLAGAQPGDILVYQRTNGVNGGAHYDHVAVYIGGGMAVHGGWNGGNVVIAGAGIGSGISVVRP